MSPTALCALVLPCHNEALALPAILASVPSVLRVIVVDNRSTDGTAEVARAHGARVVVESRPGYGAAVQAGVEAAEEEYVAVMDGDGSFDPRQVVPLLRAVVDGEADLALGRRRPVSHRVWPWHARVGNTLVVAWLRRTSGFPARDLAPMRVSRRADLVALDVRDRRFGYPLELLRKASAAGWRIAEIDVSYRPRATGTRSKVSGSFLGTVRTVHDFWKVLAT